MLDDNPTGLERAEIERVAGNQYNKLLGQQQDSKSLSPTKGITTADRGEENRKPRSQFEGKCFNCGRRGHRAEKCRSGKKKIEKGDVAADNKGGGRARDQVCGSKENFAHKHCDFSGSLEH